MSRKSSKYKGRIFWKRRDDNIDWCKKQIQKDRKNHDLSESSSSTRIDIWENLRKNRVIYKIPYYQRKKSNHSEQYRGNSRLEGKLSKCKKWEEENNYSDDYSDDQRSNHSHKYTHCIIFWRRNKLFWSKIIDVFDGWHMHKK